MKRIAVVSIVAMVLVLTAVVIVRADKRGRHGVCGHRRHRPGQVSYLAHELKLSDAQLAQVRMLWQAERPVVSADVRRVLAEDKEMNAIAAQGSPDQGKIQDIAAREATAIAALLVEKERLQSKIYAAVLNPEQRTKAKELQKRLEFHLDRAADRLGTQPAEE